MIEYCCFCQEKRDTSRNIIFSKVTYINNKE